MLDLGARWGHKGRALDLGARQGHKGRALDPGARQGRKGRALDVRAIAYAKGPEPTRSGPFDLRDAVIYPHRR